MAKYVNSATAAEIISEYTNIPLHELVDIMAEVPSEDVEPVRHGRWKKSKGNERPTENGFVHDDRYVCDCCGWGCCCETKLDFSFCPNCGARMDGDADANGNDTMTIKLPKLDAPCKGCEQRSERCHITCDKYKQFGEELSKFRFYERKQNNDISGIIQSLQNSNTNCRRKSTWR